MRVYRVFPYRSGAAPGEAGHPTYVPPASGKNRLDNPGHYVVRYFAENAAAAVAETLGQNDTWQPAIFRGRPGSGMQRALATYDLRNTERILDLDNARTLLDRELRPTQVVRRNLKVTQAWALQIYEERSSARGARRWDGVRWWSWYRPEWPVVGLWSGDVDLLEVEPLDLRHAAVREAATMLGRTLVD